MPLQKKLSLLLSTLFKKCLHSLFFHIYSMSMKYNLSNIKQINIKQNIKKHIFSTELTDILSKYSSFFLSCNIGYIDQELTSLFFLKSESEYLILIESQFTDSVIFILQDILSKEKINPLDQFKILSLFNETDNNLNDLYKLLNIFKWPSGSKGIKYLESISLFSINLQNMFFAEKISLNTAFLLHRTIPSNIYDPLINIVPKENSFSDNNHLITNITEIFRLNPNNFDSIIHKIINNMKSINSIIYEARFPLLSSIQNRFESFIRSLKLGNNTVVIWDNNFESHEYELKIKFNSLNNLRKTINELEIKLSSYQSDDLFIYDNLCKDPEK